jgi:hypothetical protein
MYLLPMCSARIDQFTFDLDAFDISEAPKLIEHESIAAADIKNSLLAIRRNMSPYDVQHGFFASAPPPMSLIQIPVMSAVL